MAFDAKGLESYIDVAQRLADFREQYPEGALRPWNPAEPYRLVQAQGTEKNGDVAQQTFVVVVAAAYRGPDDANPGVGMAWEIFPGRTPYTRGSELMNAETSAWGRAILAVLASDSRRGVASREEVRNRAAEREEEGAAPRRVPTAHTDPEHVRLVHEEPGGIAGAVGRVEGSTRLAAVPPDDPWYDQPPQPQKPPEDRPGTIDKADVAAIQAHYKNTSRDDRLAEIARIIGRKVPTLNALTYAEGRKVRQQVAS